MGLKYTHCLSLAVKSCKVATLRLGRTRAAESVRRLELKTVEKKHGTLAIRTFDAQIMRGRENISLH